MTEQKNPQGRPARKYPPRIDATPEEIAYVVLNAGRPKESVKDKDYSCGGCEREVHYRDQDYALNVCRAPS